MLRDDETLRGAVEAQAIALTRGDLAMFASYAELRALPLLYRAGPLERCRRFKLGAIGQSSEEHGTSEVRFAGPDGYVLRGEWLHTDMGWKAVSFDVQSRRQRTGLWRRLLRRPPAASLVTRQDLS